MALRALLTADGYVFLRGLLPADRVRAAGELIAATLHAGGWTAAGSPRLGPAAGPREALTDPAYRAAVLSLAFNELPYLTPLRGTVRRLLGPGAFSYPLKVLRAVAPESVRRGARAAGVRGAADPRPVRPLRLPGVRRPGHADYLDAADRGAVRARRPRCPARRPPGAAPAPTPAGWQPTWLGHHRLPPRGRGHLSLPDPARGSPQHRSPASAVRRFPLAGTPLSRPSGDDSRARGASTRAIAPAAGPGSLVGTGPAGPDAPAALGTGCPAATPVAVFRGPPAMATVAFPAWGSSLEPGQRLEPGRCLAPSRPREGTLPDHIEQPPYRTTAWAGRRWGR